jgi:MinD-like ATPase involved in chromosome partitioning or flagellar assembly
MGSVLLHIAHEAGGVDVVLADDEPVGRLMPDVLAAAGVAPDGASWRLAPLDGAPLRSDHTLSDAAVLSGGVLHLVTERRSGDAPPPPPSPPPPTRATPSVPPEDGSPWERTRALLPPRRSAPARARLAAKALLRTRRDRPVELAPDKRYGPSPGELTMAKNAGPVTRSRDAWRETDYLHVLERLVVEPRLAHCATIAVVSPKGGVGKTTITTLLGTLFAQLRRDRIVAIDTNPDHGSLGRTLASSHNVYVDDLLAVLDHPALTATQLDASLARAAHGLLVLPAPTAPERMARLDHSGYSRVIQRLQSLVSVILLDCGTGLWEPAAQVALASASQAILVSDAEPATASLIAEAALPLRTLDVPVTLVVNRANRGGRLDIERFAQSIPWARGLVTVSAERRAAASIGTGDFSWDHAPRGWGLALRELGALLAGDWDRLGLTL